MTYGELFTPNPDPLSLVDETHSDDYYERDRGGGKDGRSSGVDSDRCREHGSLSLDEGCQRSAARPISSGGGEGVEVRGGAAPDKISGKGELALDAPHLFKEWKDL